MNCRALKPPNPGGGRRHDCPLSADAPVDALALAPGDRAYEVMAYDNTVRECHSVHAEVVFMRGRFKGAFVVLDQEIGVLGRNILNHFVVTLDGPRLEWDAR